MTADSLLAINNRTSERRTGTTSVSTLKQKEKNEALRPTLQYSQQLLELRVTLFEPAMSAHSYQLCTSLPPTQQEPQTPLKEPCVDSQPLERRYGPILGAQIKAGERTFSGMGALWSHLCSEHVELGLSGVAIRHGA